MAAQAQDLDTPAPTERKERTIPPVPEGDDDPRAALFSRLTQLALGPALDPQQGAQLDDSLAELVRTVALPMRVRIAQTIGPVSMPLPRLVTTLAKDEIDVARPILRASPVLGEDMLVDLIETGSRSHRLEIAARPGLTARITSDLIDLDDLEVIQTVAGNGTAAFTPKTLDRMVRASEGHAQLTETLLKRADLPALSAHRMFWWVAGPFRELILRNHVVDIRDLRRLLSESFEAGLVDGVSSDALDRVLATMMKHTRAPTSDLVTILRRGSLPAFVDALQESLGVDNRTARRIVEDNGGEAVAVACRALDADRAQFTSIFLLLDYLRFGKARPVARLAQISAIYDRVPHARAAASVVMWTVLTQDIASESD